MDKQTKEIFCITQEECAEVTQAISKVFRFGIDTSWNGRTNKQRLEEEVGDLLAMIGVLINEGIIDRERVDEASFAKLEKLSKWSKIDLSTDK